MVYGKILNNTEYRDMMVLQDFNLNTDHINQLLFFLKPEFFQTEKKDQDTILNYINTTLENNNISVDGIAFFRGIFLKKFNIMDRHYGYINTLSKHASKVLTAETKKQLISTLEIENDLDVLGGHEALTAFGLTSADLDAIWQQKKSKKLKSGMYYQSYNISNKEIVMINGFHPKQLNHFTNPNSKMVVMLLSSNLPWSLLRNKILGNTFPEKAEDNSIRRYIFDYFGSTLEKVSIAYNFTHMSAGPFEAAFEIDNFFRSTDVGLNYNDLSLVKLLPKTLSFNDIIQNPSIRFNGIVSKLFELTEELDTITSANLLPHIEKIK